MTLDVTYADPNGALAFFSLTTVYLLIAFVLAAVMAHRPLRDFDRPGGVERNRLVWMQLLWPVFWLTWLIITLTIQHEDKD